VIESGEAANIEDAYRDERFDKTTDERTGYVTRNILAIPLVNSGRVVGALMALNHAEAFDAGHQQTLEFIAQEVSSTMLAPLLHQMMMGSSEDHSRNDEALRRVRMALLSEYATMQNMKADVNGRSIQLASDILSDQKSDPPSRPRSSAWFREENDGPLPSPLAVVPSSLKVEELDSLNFDPDRFSLPEQLQIAHLLVERSGLLSGCDVPPEALSAFLQAVSTRYRAENPYHNFTHALHVMQGCYWMLSKGGNLSSRIAVLSPAEMLVLLITAVGHDIEHPGLNNAFMINSSSPLALRYNDVSVLENHHASTLATILSDPSSDVLRNFDKEEKRMARKMMIKSVLATDMAGHLDMVKDLTARASSSEPVAALDVAAFYLHLADLSNCVVDWSISKRWAERICNESVAQVVRETEMGLPPSAGSKATPYAEHEIAGRQLVFLDGWVRPFFKGAALLFEGHEGVKSCLDQIEVNRQACEREMQPPDGA